MSSLVVNPSPQTRPSRTLSSPLVAHPAALAPPSWLRQISHKLRAVSYQWPTKGGYKFLQVIAACSVYCPDAKCELRGPFYQSMRVTLSGLVQPTFRHRAISSPRCQEHGAKSRSMLPEHELQLLYLLDGKPIQ